MYIDLYVYLGLTLNPFFVSAGACVGRPHAHI